MPGLVSVLSRRGEVAIDTLGVTAVGGDQPMRSDTIFRITSMTKPVTAVAAMILVEECVLRLDDPVDGLLPELADRRVLRRFDGPLDDTVPARRPITLRDLLTFRLGLGMVLAPPDTYPIQRAESELGLATFGPPKPATVHAPDEWMRRPSVELMTTNHVTPTQRAAASPLLQPNAGWGFGVSVTTARENTWAPAATAGTAGSALRGALTPASS